MQIQENISLKKFNTFGIDVSAKYFSSFTNLEEFSELLEFKANSTFNTPTLNA